MSSFRKLILATAAAATLVGAAAPAAARPWGWGGPRYYGHWHGGGDLGGALVGGLILGGIIGAVAASAHDREPRGDQPPSAQDRAADACAAAVEDDRRAPVNRINAVDWFDEAWHVTGVVNGGERDSRPDSFSCTFRYGQVEGIRYGSDYAPRG